MIIKRRSLPSSGPPGIGAINASEVIEGLVPMEETEEFFFPVWKSATVLGV